MFEREGGGGVLGRSMWCASPWLMCALVLSGCSGSDSDGPAGAPDGSTQSDGGDASFGNSSSDGGGGRGPRRPDGGPGAGDSGMPTAPAITGVKALRIEPGSDMVVDDGADPGETVEFHAIGTFANGERDVTALVAWSLDDEELGEIEAGTFTSASIGGQTQVEARALGVEASADLTVMLEVQAPSGAPGPSPPAPREPAASSNG